ncbi:hypothetical protein [Streptomyces sp. NPDC058625]|uniref:hypothetical protein n=1 Tax=Streptomyces sp. NPDC058625 TaxID=3346564 RepID=UPI003649F8EA
MRGYKKPHSNRERRALTEKIRETTIVTFIQVTLTVTLNALAAALLTWLGTR